MITHTQNFLAGQAVQVLPWPSCSPDFNPIENLWFVLKRKIRRRMGPNSTMLDLWRVAVEEWQGIAMWNVHTLIGSMRQHCMEVANSRGAYNHYWRQISINVIPIMQMCFLASICRMQHSCLVIKMILPFHSIQVCHPSLSQLTDYDIVWFCGSVALTPVAWYTEKYPDVETISTSTYS